MGRKSKQRLANERNNALRTPKKQDTVGVDEEDTEEGTELELVRQNLANTLTENEKLRKEVEKLNKTVDEQTESFRNSEIMGKELEQKKKRENELKKTIEALRIDLKESERKKEVIEKVMSNLKQRLQSNKDETPIPSKVRKIFNDISSKEYRDKRCEQLMREIEEKEGKDGLDGFLKYFIHYVSNSDDSTFKLNLSVEETAYCKLKFKWSDGFIKEFKSFCKSHLGFDVLASRHLTDKLLKQADVLEKYNVELEEVERKINNKVVKENAPVVTIKDMKSQLESRLSVLSKYGNLLEGDIVVGIGGDKGGDTTKLCMIIENVSRPNNPQGILLLGQYTGQDNHKNMREHFSDVFKQINALTNVEFEDGNGSKICLPVKKKAIGDCIFMCSLQNHTGPTSSNPCFICEYKYSTHGINKEMVGNSDFDVCHKVRTLEELKKSGDPLIEMEPADYGIPPIHTIHGVVQKFAVDPLIALANQLDLGSLPSDLSQQRDHLKDLKNCEDSALARYEDSKRQILVLGDLLAAWTKMERTRKTTRTNTSNCSSSCCIVKWCKKKMSNKNETHSCASCGKLFHLFCSNIIASDDRLRVLNGISKFDCFACQLGTLPSVSDYIAKINMITVDVRKMMEEEELEYCTWHNDRTEVEKQLKLSHGEYRKKMECAFREMGCDHRIWYQEMTGNQIRKLLRDRNIDKLVSIFPDSSEIRMIRDLLMELSFIMTHSDNAYKTNAEIDDIKASILRFTAVVRKLHPNTGVTLKLHLLTAHLVDHLHKHRSWGKVSEQGIESLHALINGLSRTYASVHEPKFKAVLILQYLVNMNYVFDMGQSWMK
ncbi:unnamed protein product [Caenorhabditis brenneri]